MKKNKYLITIVFSLFITLNSIGQVGIGTTTPQGALDVDSTTDGLLIPRLALTISTSALPLTAPTTSELVYNTATVADVTPGYYYWDSAAWVRLATGTVVETDPQVSSVTSSRVPRWNGTTLVDGSIFDNTTRVGIGTAAPAGVLDVTSTTDGFLIPRVALTGTASAVPLTFPTTSEMVYNTATVSDVTPGYYYWNGSSWLRLATGNTGWLTTGNTGIIDGTNFIGTAAGTNIDVAFRRNNSAAGKIGATSTSFGVGALSAGASTNSTAIGNNALSVSTGNNNVAVGQNALVNSASTAQWNTAVGTSSLRGINDPAAQNNTAIGFEAMTGAGNISNVTAVGARALFQNTANNSTAVGFNALQGQVGGATGNTGVGASVLNNNTNGDNNTAVGNEAGFGVGGSNNTLIGYYAGRFSSGGNNTALGFSALSANGASSNSVAIGYNALTNSTAADNTAVGTSALGSNVTGTGNVAIGNQAGFSETGSNKLYISNSATTPTTSLVYGEFSPTPILRTNGTLQIGDPAGVNGYALPIVRGTANQILQTNGAGATSWVSASTLSVTETDPQVSSATNNTIPKWNGTTLVDGIMTDNGTSVSVAGTTSTTNLQMTSGAAANFVLQSDAVGNASWVNANTLAITETDPQVSSATNNTIPKWNGTTLVDGVVTDDGTNVGVGVAPSVGNKLDVAGKTRTTNFQMTTGATANFVLQSDATGNGAWVNANTLTITETDPQVSSVTASRVPRWNGTTLVDGTIFDNTVSVGIGTAAPAGVLDITSTTNGLLIPRVALTSTTLAAPLTFPANSEIVFNTNTAGDVTPGYYYWFGGVGGNWFRIATANTNGWSITGNTGIIDGTNFIGTAAGTNVDVAFRRNNLAAGKIGATSTSFGVGALSSGATTNSTAIGNNALSVSTGNNNVAVGQNALRDCAASADFNTAVGTNALQGLNLASSNRNTVVGFEAMGTTTGDIQNCTAVGFQALYSVDGSTAMRGINNTAIGYQAGNAITTGENNIAIGYLAQVASATGNNQIKIGNNAITLAECQVAWTLTSDKRWKDNIKDSSLGLNFLKTLRPVSYTRNNDKKQKTEYGFIAQDVDAALQKAGDTNNGIITKDDKGMLGVRYNDFISISVKAIQEQQQLIEELQKSNAELKKANAAILERLEKLEKN
ncbi:MAG: tail fiber domain-containing protein [Flavobacterium sp.]|nr:tail fiber domain-containing protein [Flavobacterium sp.]